jgi:hypothetical protein
MYDSTASMTAGDSRRLRTSLCADTKLLGRGADGDADADGVPLLLLLLARRLPAGAKRVRSPSSCRPCANMRCATDMYRTSTTTCVCHAHMDTAE